MGLSRYPILLLVLLLLTNVVWLSLDHSIPAWDDAYYLTNSLRTYDALANQGLTGFARQFLHGMATKPPLIATLPVPVYSLVGRNPRVALWINVAFLLVILATTYFLARSFAGSTAGLVALCIVGTMPMVYGLSRVYLVECGLTALVTLTLYLLACTDTKASWVLGTLGAVCGLGLLMKTSFPVYVVAPIIWALIVGGHSLLTPSRIASFLVPLLLIAGPWYAVNAAAALQTALLAGSAETARVYQTGGLAETGEYLINLMNCGPRLYFVALPLLAILCMGRMTAATRRGILFCIVAASPLAFLTFSHYRDLRYAAPFFPVIAVALGILAAAAIARFPAAAIAVILLLVVGTADMLDATFGFMNTRLQAAGLLLSIPRFSYVHSPQRTYSPYPDLLAAMQKRGSAPHRLVLGSDTVTVNADTLTLTALAERIPLQVVTTAYASPAALPSLLASASYFAYVDNAADSPFNTVGRAAVTLVRSDPRFHEFTFLTLPDGSQLHVLESAETSSAPPDTSIRFGQGIELTGLSLKPAPGGLEANYRWHSYTRIPRDYWTFGHILDAHGKVLAYLDHAIQPQSPPSQWQIGDTVIEKTVVRIPATDNAVPRAVRLGVFDRQSGDRLPVLSSAFPLADSGTGTVVPVP